MAIQEDWDVFSDVLFSKTIHLDLLAAILAGARNPRGDSFDPQNWVLNFSRQAMRTESGFWSRMFQDDPAKGSPSLVRVREEIDTPGTLESQVGDHLSYLAVLVSSGQPLFRVRAACEANGVSHSPHRDIGPNPRHPASRANADGQYAIYLSESEATAVAEVRQPAGSFLSAGEFVLARDATVVDLCQSFGSPNPFVTTNLAWILDLTNLLRNVATTISKPVENPRDYGTTQLLANIARAIGYDGIRYPSALDANGRNIVLFEQDIVSIQSSWVDLLGEEGFKRL